MAMVCGTLMLLDVALTAEGQVASKTVAHGTLALQFGERAAEGQTARLSMSAAPGCMPLWN